MSCSTKVSYVRVGSSGLKVSRLILGTMQFGSKAWQPWILEEEEAIQHIKTAYEMGIQTFDTADVYSNGATEIILGKAIKKLNLPRENIVVMTKLQKFVPRSGPQEWFWLNGRNPEDLGYVNCSGLSRKHIFDAVKASLERLQLDYIDVIQCHSFDDSAPVEEIMIALHDVVKSGYARYIGMGTCYAYKFHQMQNYAVTHNLTPFISVQNQYSLLWRDDENELYPTLGLFNSGSFAFSPLARGLLARNPSSISTSHDSLTQRGSSDPFLPFYQKFGPEKDQEVISRVQELAREKNVSMAQLALAWVLHKPGVTAPIIGPTSIKQLQELTDALKISLTEKELAFLEEPYVPRPKLVEMGHSYYRTNLNRLK